MSLDSRVFFVLSCLLYMFPYQKVIAGNNIQHPFYVGLAGGYGSTTWDGLVPENDNQNDAMNLSTPIKVDEGGGVFGVFTGYEFSPYFALEATYMRYSTAKVIFDPMSLFSFENDEEEEFFTHTESISLMGKIMAPIGSTPIKIYSSAGVARIHRTDKLLNAQRYSPTFSVGLSYDFSTHIMGEIGGNYTAGFGESQMNPTETYFPFLYSAFLRLGYRV